MASILAGASNVTISGGTFSIHHSHPNQTVRISAFDKLSAAAAHSALHDAPARTDESRCHQDTRTSVLDHLERWAQGICEEGASIFWLHGGAGAGKSAIMQSLAERCAAQGLALGSFFFFRSDPTRNSADVLIPTLVYQLAQLFSSLMDILGPIMDRDPLIFKKSFQVQLLSVLVPALHHLIQVGIISDTPQSPRVFLIDGLDECNDPVQQQAIIQTVVAVCHEYRIPVKFLIASRPELAISTSFGCFEQENHILGSVSLSEDPDAEVDIRRFIEDEFLKIRLQHPFRKMIPSDWPSLDDINSLVWKSSSHFIYTSTSMKYIYSAKENPVRSLQVVLGLQVARTVSPFSELDALYHYILGFAAHRDKVLQILAHCVYTQLPSFPVFVCSMLNCSADDLFIYMADMSPLLVIKNDPELMNGLEVKLLHASLGDFLQDRSRSGSLYINKEVYLGSNLDRCFQLFDLHSQQKRAPPDWPTYWDNRQYEYHAILTREIIKTIVISGHLVVTEEVLRRYSFRDFYQCLLRFKQNLHYIPDFPGDLSYFLVAVHWMKTPNAARLFKSFAEDFFDILESNLNLENVPLVPAIVTLAFCGYTVQVLRRILGDHFIGKPSPGILRSLHISPHHMPNSGNIVGVLDIIAAANTAPVLQSTNTFPKRLAVAAESILEYLIDQVNLQFLSTNSTHKSWLQRMKPGKRVAIGAPRLASAFHTLCLSTLHRLEDPDYIYGFQAFDHGDAYNLDILNHRLKTLSMVLGPKYGISDTLERQKDRARMVVDLFDALIWLLPKAGFSQKIVLYSKRMFPWKIYQREAGLVRRARKCLDEYTTRVRNATLEELGHRIENGDSNALIEKSRMLGLNAQD